MPFGLGKIKFSCFNFFKEVISVGIYAEFDSLSNLEELYQSKNKGISNFVVPQGKQLKSNTLI